MGEDEATVEPKGKLIQRYLHEDSYQDGSIKAENINDPDERKRFYDLCEACRSGDIEQVDKLVSFGVNLNAIDKFDTTPLILASLCGHERIVVYLLEHGAICDRDTFQGERCLYGALTERIRQILLKFDISKSVDTDQPFAAHISLFFSNRTPIDAHDIVFETDNTNSDDEVMSFKLHRFILSARSDYFARNLLDRWTDKTVVKLAAAMEPAAFNFVIRYIYMYDQPLPKQPQLLQSIIKTARKLELVDLVREIEEQCNDMDNGNISNKEMTARARKRRGQRENDMWKARLQFEVFAEKNVIGRKVVLKEDDADLSQEQFDCLSSLQTSPDILLEVSLSTGTTVYYPSHKSMLIRSEYYLTMFTSSFAEANEQEALPILELPVTSIEVAELVLTFLYTDRVDVPISYAMEVLYAADLLLIDRLKSLASITITNCTVDQLPSNMTIFDILRASWTLRSDRLERYVAKIIADNFDIYISQPEFRKIVMESANRIEARQETDTIELIDDVRFFLARKYGIIFEDERSIIVKNSSRQPQQAQQNDNDKGIVKVGKVEEHRWNSQYELEYNSQLDRIEDLLVQLGLDA